MSESEAYLRIAVARVARKHPKILPMLQDGRLHLSGIAKLAPVLTAANCDDLLGRAMRKTKKKIEELVAEVAPKPDVVSEPLPVYYASAESLCDAVGLGLDRSCPVPGGAGDSAYPFRRREPLQLLEPIHGEVNSPALGAVRMDSASPGKPEILFRRAFRVAEDFAQQERQYDISRDGRHFVMVQRGGSNQFNVILDFLDELEQKMQTR